MNPRKFHAQLNGRTGPPWPHSENGSVNGNGHKPALAVKPTSSARRRQYVLITGGAGFVGTNLAARLLRQGESVMVLDSLARAGVEANLEWLKQQFGSALRVRIADVRNERAVCHAVAAARRVYHFAAQVAVTTSLNDPRSDFDINARGALNVLEAVRRQADPPPVLFTSTNKVYGELTSLKLLDTGSRYEPTLRRLHEFGINESQPLDLYSPYGCSKGAADQYMLDYARCYRLPAVVFRMSCIYGPHQCGTEDQGWVAHFLIQALRGKPITIYGDGKQVRDVLYVDDLVDAMTGALEQIEATSGRKFNIGGGTQNATSLLELVQIIRRIGGRSLRIHFAPWRVGDQRYYVSDTRAFQNLTGWRPQVSVEDGVRRLYDWLEQNVAPQQQPGSLLPAQRAPLGAVKENLMSTND